TCALPIFAGWRGKHTLEAHREMMRLTLDIVGATLLGVRFGVDRTADAFSDAIELLSYRSNSFNLPLTWPTPTNQRLKRALAYVDTTVKEILGKGSSNATLLGMLLDARDENGNGLSPQELRNEVVTLILAGHETTALLLSWGF